MNITEIIPTEISGYCDAGSGECITTQLLDLIDLDPAAMKEAEAYLPGSSSCSTTWPTSTACSC